MQRRLLAAVAISAFAVYRCTDPPADPFAEVEWPSIDALPSAVPDPVVLRVAASAWPEPLSAALDLLVDIAMSLFDEALPLLPALPVKAPAAEPAMLPPAGVEPRTSCTAP